MLNLNFTMSLAAQDMICIIMEKKKLSNLEAIKYAINKNMYEKIIKTGWASIAFDLWGHDDPDREWKKLENPIIKLEIDTEQEILLLDIASRENVDMETAVGFFLIFVMDSLGYHI